MFYNLGLLKVKSRGDIGCYTLGALPPLSAMDTCVDMGASITVLLGIEKALAKAGKTIKQVAVIGDSTFFHSGITGLIDVIYNQGQSTVVILDNSITAMTGHQENPGSGKTLMGEDGSAHRHRQAGARRAGPGAHLRGGRLRRQGHPASC